MKRPQLTAQEYIEELYKKGSPNPDNHDAVISHLEPDILECEVKRALGSITSNKASTGDGIPVELFQILKDDAVKVLHSICQQIWKTQGEPLKPHHAFAFCRVSFLMTFAMEGFLTLAPSNDFFN